MHVIGYGCSLALSSSILASGQGRGLQQSPPTHVQRGGFNVDAAALRPG